MGALAVFALIGSAFASSAQALVQSESAPTGAPTEASSEQNEKQDIVVVAERPEQSSIDRTTYIVKDNAEARASSALELLGRVPSVDVSPSGQVRLIGRSGVAIQVDGQEVPNANAFLRAMQGSQVAKIEVVTNPSAQFSARGTGGIINIITRRSSGAGLGGSVTGSVGSFGAYEARASPSWGWGKVSLGGSVGVSRSGQRSGLDEEWDRLETGKGIDRREDKEIRGQLDLQSANIRATVQLAPKQSLSLTADAVHGDGTTSGEAEIADAGTSLTERSLAASDFQSRNISADYRSEGSRPGEQTNFSASHRRLRSEARSSHLTSADDGSSSLFRRRSEGATGITLFKLDHIRPAGDRRLAAGGLYQRNKDSDRQRTRMEGSGGEPLISDTAVEGKWSEAAAYVTYQFRFQGMTMQAGTRVESRRYDIAGVADQPAGGTHLFPSLHIERKLAKWLTGNVSYSRRVLWPNIAELDPRLRFNSPKTASAGNPSLEPEKTHSLEAKLMAAGGSHGAEVTAYYQRTRDLRSVVAELEGDVLITRPVNLGTRTSIGTNLQMRGPLAKRLKYVFTANLARHSIAGADLVGFDDSGTSYGGSVQFEYRDGTESRAGADHIRLGVNYSGPTETGFARTSSVVRATASWSHALTDRWSAVATASHFLNSPRSTVFGSDVISRQESRFSGPKLNLALTYGLSPSGQ